MNHRRGCISALLLLWTGVTAAADTLTRQELISELLEDCELSHAPAACQKNFRKSFRTCDRVYGNGTGSGSVSLKDWEKCVMENRYGQNEELAGLYKEMLGLNEPQDISDLPLPVYPRAWMMVHYDEGQLDELLDLRRETSLAKATFSSRDPLSLVRRYYEERLQDFHLVKVRKGYLFVRDKLPIKASSLDLDKPEHLRILATREYVFIEPTSLPDEEAVRIQMSYRE